MMSSAVRVSVAMVAVAVVGCSSGGLGGKSGTGRDGGGAQGGAGTNVNSGGSGGGVGGIIGSAGTVGNGGTTSSGGTTGGGGNAGGGNAGGGAMGGAIGNGGAGGGPASSGGVDGDAGDRGGTSTPSEAGASHDATSGVDAPVCPACPPMRCTYGSPVDSNGCALCTCNPAPDGGIDLSTDAACGLPEGCVDAGGDARIVTEAGGRSDVIRFDGTGVTCGTIVCAWCEHCCGLEGGGLSPPTPWCASGNIICI